MRREEVAERAGVSVDYIIRLEQGRPLHPSPSVLDALARALRMSSDERRYLFDLAGQRPPNAVEPAAAQPPPDLGEVIATFAPMPAAVLNHRFDIIAWNPALAALLTDFDALPPAQRNAVRLCLMDPVITARYLEPERVRRDGIAHLRAAWAAHPHDEELRSLIEGILAADDELARLWEEHDVRVNGHAVKSMRHPRLGLLTARFDLLAPVQHPEHRLLVVRGSDADSAAALAQLAPAG